MENKVNESHDALFGHNGDQKSGLVWKVDQLSLFMEKVEASFLSLKKHAWKFIFIVTLGAGASVWNCVLEMIKSHVTVH